MMTSGQLSLKQRVLKAGMWSLAGYALSLIIRLGSSLLMTRLLVPEMFGVMAVASTVMIGLTMFSDVGLKQSVVQSIRGSEPAFLNTAWSLQIVRGGLLFLTALCLCLFMIIAGRANTFPEGSVYATPILPYVVAALSTSVIIAGFESTKLYEASRGILLGQITGIELVAQLVGLACMLAWVSIDRSIWALVAGSIGSSLTRALLSHIRLPGVRNRWQWDRQAVREIISFGKWILASSTLGFLVSSGDRLLLAGLVSSTVLGYYSIASLFVVSAEGVLSKIMLDVSFPAFSEVVRSQVKNLKQNYYRFLIVIASVAYFTSGFLMASGQSLINILYDRRYADAGWMLQVLSATLLTVPFRLATLSFLALGMPRLQSDILVVRLILMLVAIPFGFKLYEFEGALVGFLISQFSSIPILIFYNLKYHLFDLRKELYLLVVVPIGLLAGKIAALILDWLHVQLG